MIEIKLAKFPKDLTGVIDIYKEYINSTVADLAFQNNEEDFKNLSKTYSTKKSKIFLAYKDNFIVGCAAFREVDGEICEMKRVYVRPTARGEKLGAKLVEKVLHEAKRSGYKKICLDVLPEFKTALALYKSYGFTDHEPITHNPIPNTKFLGLDLT